MLEKIMDLVKNQVMDTVSGMTDIPEEKKTETVDTTTRSLMDGLKKYASPENISSLASLFGESGSGTNPAVGKTSGITDGLASNVVSSLTSQVGLAPSTAQKIASMVIPAVMALFKKKAADGNDPAFNLESLLGSLSGKSTESSTGGMMDMLGSIFGKKS